MNTPLNGLQQTVLNTSDIYRCNDDINDSNTSYYDDCYYYYYY